MRTNDYSVAGSHRRPTLAVAASAREPAPPKQLWLRAHSAEVASATKAGRPEGRCDRGGGFTIVELLIVLSVILILAAIMVKVWPEFEERIIRLRCQTNLGKAQKIFLEYGANNYGYLPPISGSGTNAGDYIYKGGKGDLNYVVMELQEYGAGPDIFNCPAWDDYGDENNYYYTQWDDPIDGGIRTKGYVMFVGFWPWVTGNNWQWHPWLLPNARKKADRVDSPGNPPLLADDMRYDPGSASWTGVTWNGFYHWRNRDDFPDSPGGGGYTVFLNGAIEWFTWEELLAKSQEDPAPVPFSAGTFDTRRFYAGWAP